MPSNSFKKIFNLEDGNKVLVLVMDTSPFIDSYYKKGTDMYENIIAQDTTAQKKWLIQELETKNQGSVPFGEICAQ